MALIAADSAVARIAVMRHTDRIPRAPNRNAHCLHLVPQKKTHNARLTTPPAWPSVSRAGQERRLPPPPSEVLTVVSRPEWNSRFVAAVLLLDRSADDAEIGRIAEAAFPSAGLLAPEEAACSYLALSDRLTQQPED